MKKYLKIIIPFLTLALFFITVGFIRGYHYPQFKTWALIKLYEISEKHLPLRVRARDLEVNFFPPGITLHNVIVKPKGELAKIVAPMTFAQMGASIGWFNLFTAQLTSYEVSLVHPDITMIIPPSEKKGWSIPVTEILRAPIDTLDVQDLDLKLFLKKENLIINLKEANFSLSSSGREILSQIHFPIMMVRQRGEKQKTTQVGLEARVLLEKNSIQVSTFKLQKDSNIIMASGRLMGNLEQGQLNDIFSRARLHLDLPSLIKWQRNVAPKLDIPEMGGIVDAQVNIIKNPETEYLLKGKIKSNDLSIKKKFLIGNAAGEFEVSPTFAKINNFIINNDSGAIHVKNAKLLRNESSVISGHLQLRKLELSRLLHNLGVPNVPVYLDISGELPCSGKIKPLGIRCEGAITAANLDVRDGIGKNTKSIVQVDEFVLNGAVDIDGQSVRPRANIRIGKAVGTAEGQVDFEKGFHFNYKTDQLDFKEIRNLAELRLEGQAALEGSTSGDSLAAVIDMNLDAKNFWFENYAVGNAKSKLLYKKGHFILPAIEGQFGSSKYQGNVDVDLVQKRLKAFIKAPLIEARDIQRGVERYAQLPFNVFGTGSGIVQVEGPFEFTALNYDLTSSFQQGLVGNEAFDEFRFNIHARNGLVKTDFVQIRKGDARINLNGEGYPDGQIDVVLGGRQIRIEDLDLVSSADLGTSAILDFDANLTNHVLRPDVSVKGSLKDMLIGPDPVGETTFDLAVKKENLAGNFSGFDGRVRGNFDIPFEPNRPFAVNVDAKQWHFAPLFSLLSGPTAARQGYETELTGAFRLESKDTTWENLNGSLNFPDFRIRRGGRQMEISQPLRAKINKGVLTIDSLSFHGDDTQVTISTRRSSPNALDLSINGQVDMSLMAFLTPFLDDLRGKLSLAAHVGGTVYKPEILGSSFVEKGYAKIRGFPHAVEDLKADVLFSQRRVIINSFGGEFAGGKLFADGQIKLVGLRDFPTDIQLRLDDTSLKVPEGYLSRGSGKLRVTGRWFPYLLSGEYEIKDGLLNQEFTTQMTPATGVRRSSLLPNFLTRTSFEAVQFNILTKIEDGKYRIRNSLMDSAIQGSLTLKGTPTNPIVLGQVNTLKGGQVFFHDTPFEILVANVKFEDPNEINPNVFLTGRTRVNRYDVNMLFQGNTKDYKLDLTSQPDLPKNDIISLLALGVTASDLEKTKDPRAQLFSTAGGQLGKTIKSGLGLEGLKDVDVRISSEADQTSDDTVKNTVQKVVVSKKDFIAKDIEASFSRAIGQTQSTDVKVKYQLNENLAAIGSWEGREETEDATSANQSTSKRDKDSIGLDVEYRVEF